MHLLPWFFLFFFLNNENHSHALNLNHSRNPQLIIWGPILEACCTPATALLIQMSLLLWRLFTRVTLINVKPNTPRLFWLHFTSCDVFLIPSSCWQLLLTLTEMQLLCGIGRECFVCIVFSEMQISCGMCVSKITGMWPRGMSIFSISLRGKQSTAYNSISIIYPWKMRFSITLGSQGTWNKHTQYCIWWSNDEI